MDKINRANDRRCAFNAFISSWEKFLTETRELAKCTSEAYCKMATLLGAAPQGLSRASDKCSGRNCQIFARISSTRAERSTTPNTVTVTRSMRKSPFLAYLLLDPMTRYEKWCWCWCPKMNLYYYCVALNALKIFKIRHIFYKRN